MTRKPINLPPSINKAPGADASPSAKARWKAERRKQSGVSLSELCAFIDLAAKLRGVSDVRRVLEKVDPDTVARGLLAENDAKEAAAMRPVKKKGPGRPKLYDERHYLYVMVTVEAYIGAGLSRSDALDRASDKWGRGRTYIEDDIYCRFKLEHERSEAVREFFHGDSVEEIDDFIRQFKAAERQR